MRLRELPVATDSYVPEAPRPWAMKNTQAHGGLTAAGSACEPRNNHLLAMLPEADWQRWSSLLEPVQLLRGQVLCESGCAPQHVYFPTSAVVSLLYNTLDGQSCEVAVVGREGLTGISLFMGGVSTAYQVVVQTAGSAHRMAAHAVKQEIAHCTAVSSMMLHCVQALMAQVAHTAACHRFQSIDQLLCRRLMQGLDRSASDTLPMTHELVASLLGVRREGVTSAALRLQEDGLIAYRRGHISVLDRARLAERARSHFGLSLHGGARAGMAMAVPG
jgi:CRP-like cAMP-binding protein